MASRTAAAEHEAGHAVVAIALGHVVACVEVDEFNVTWPYGPWPDRYDPAAMAIIACAGSAANGTRFISHVDAQAFAAHSISEGSLPYLYDTAADIVRESRAAVDALAALVYAKRIVKADDIFLCVTRAAPHLKKNATRVPPGLMAYHDAYRAKIDSSLDAVSSGEAPAMGGPAMKRGVRIPELTRPGRATRRP